VVENKKRKSNREWIWSKYIICMYGNAMMKSLSLYSLVYANKVDRNINRQYYHKQIEDLLQQCRKQWNEGKEHCMNHSGILVQINDTKKGKFIAFLCDLKNINRVSSYSPKHGIMFKKLKCFLLISHFPNFSNTKNTFCPLRNGYSYKTICICIYFSMSLSISYSAEIFMFILFEYRQIIDSNIDFLSSIYM
jgi:hypothetical protein